MEAQRAAIRPHIRPREMTMTTNYNYNQQKIGVRISRFIQ